MTHARRAVLGLVLALASWPALAAPLPPPARAEVDALLAKLEGSGCQFYRNGTWYPAAEAKTHLLRKLDYLERNGTVATAEQFIDLAASGSSQSGEPYQVRCANAAPVTSAAWLRSQLETIRASKRRGP
jgi:hypothetical protein